MPIYSFMVAVDGVDLLDLDQADRLCSEHFTIVPTSIDGYVSIVVEAEAMTDKLAVQSFEEHLHAHCPEVEIVRMELDLVQPTEIATRIDVSRETVRSWATGLRGSNFPRPFEVLAGGIRVWTWTAVRDWLVLTDRLPPNDEPLPPSEATVAWFNGRYVAQGSSRDRFAAA